MVNFKKRRNKKIWGSLVRGVLPGKNRKNVVKGKNVKGEKSFDDKTFLLFY